MIVVHCKVASSWKLSIAKCKVASSWKLSNVKCKDASSRKLSNVKYKVENLDIHTQQEHVIILVLASTITKIGKALGGTA